MNPLTPFTWQPIPGCKRAEIYPYLRKPDLLSSNSCIVRTAEQILLIDPGALEDQTRELCGLIRLCQQDRNRPVLIYITHCHLDHVLQAPLTRQIHTAGMPSWIAVHEAGAGILSGGDEKRSIAELYGVPFPPFNPDLILMTKQDREGLAAREVRLAPDQTLTLHMEIVESLEGHPLYRQRIPIGEEEHLFCYPTPGHSPDSLCIQIGEVLFVGDLLAAINPMVAGLTGWNLEDYLLTLGNVLWLIENAGVGLCCPGHGGFLSASDARESFRHLIHEARHLGELEAVNRERMLFNAEYALELIDEAEEIFSAIAGRLGYVAYQLESLEEPEAASGCRALMDMDGIDAGLASFRRLCQAVEDGRLIKLKFVLAALRDVKKIRKLFDRHRLKAVIQPSLLNRADRLLLDFIGIVRGVRNPEEFVWTEPGETLSRIVRELRVSPHTDASIIDASGQEDYLAALTARIGYADLFEKTTLEVFCAGPHPPVRLAAARFADTLTHLMEFLAVKGADSISIRLEADGNIPVIRIRALGEDLRGGIGEKKVRSFARRFQMSGAVFKADRNGFEILLPGSEPRS
jgi:glyoxylase-like metal-dependent hydrolase (beta-lactamase superfamily II)